MQSDCKKCIKFAKYLVKNYVTNDSKFLPSMWEEIPSDEKSTNNVTKSFHTHLNEQFHSPHPTFFCVHGWCAATSLLDQEKQQFLMREYTKLLSGEIDGSGYERHLDIDIVPFFIDLYWTFLLLYGT